MPVTVYVWYYNESFISRHTLGHAGLRVQTVNGGDTYITWLPGGSAVKSSLPTSTYRANATLGFKYVNYQGTLRHTQNIMSAPTDGRPPQQRFPTVTAADEVATFGDSVAGVDLPEYRFDDFTHRLTIGIYPEPILSWWDAMMLLPPNDPRRLFKVGSTEQNCVSTVMKALCRGGLGGFVAPPKNWIYNDVCWLNSWLDQARSKISEMQQDFDRVHPAARDLSQGHVREMDPIIPTVSDWRTMSDKNIRRTFGSWGYASRTGPIAAIDQLLSVYHGQRKLNNQAKHIQNVCLQQIFYQCLKHSTDKPKSDRHDAIRQLFNIVSDKLSNFEWEPLGRESLLLDDDAAQALEDEVSRQSLALNRGSRQSFGAP